MNGNRCLRIAVAVVLVLGYDLGGRASAAPGHPAAEGAEDRFVTVQDGKFIDPQGRQLLLHGMSVISKNRNDNYQSFHGPEEFAQMQDWGMNCIRLGIIWDGLEPAPGQFDEQYLKKVDQRIDWAQQHGLYVFLDMHQDLYSYKFSDGAPEWATLTDGQPHVHTGGVWSDAYLTSPAIQRAFDNFWANKPCADGVGVQDHFAAAWKHVAARYADSPTVLGYDLFNEPNIGSKNLDAQTIMIQAFANALNQAGSPVATTATKIMQQWLEPQGRSQLMTRLKDMKIYTQVIDAVGPLFAEFERTLLTPMFQRVRDAIRLVDTNHIIFLETSMSANMGIPTGIEPLLGPGAKPDPLQAYAPHGYDIVVDTKDLALGSNDRVELIFSRHGQAAQRLGMPMLVGEWGAFGNAGPEILPAARFVVRQFEKLLCSETYWAYGRETASCAYLEILQRPIPARIAGTLLAYHAHPENGAFTCSWKEDPKVTAPSRIYLPRRSFPRKDAARLSPKGAGFQIEAARQGSENLFLVIPPTGQAGDRRLQVN